MDPPAGDPWQPSWIASWAIGDPLRGQGPRPTVALTFQALELSPHAGRGPLPHCPPEAAPTHCSALVES